MNGKNEEPLNHDIRHKIAEHAGKSSAFEPAEGSSFVRPIWPALVPELRAHLLKMWQPEAPFAQVAPAMGHGPGPQPVQAIVEFEKRTLERASLWWVAADMVDVLLAAAASVPDDVRGEDLVPLDTWGLVALEKPWLGLSSTPGQGQVQVDAFSWGPANIGTLPNERPDLADGMITTVSLSSYSCFPPATDLNALGVNRWALEGVLWAPLGRSDWPLVDRLDRAPWEMPDQARESFAEDRRILCALMTLLAHEGIANTTVGHAPRPVRRRLEREHGKRDNSYRIVTLRVLRDPGEEKGDTPGQKHDHRWIVTGHWRRQPYGPNRSLRRLQWINPFVKGPEDAPLKVKETIHAWRR